MNLKNLQKFSILVFLIFISQQIFTQDKNIESFYKHYTGKLDTNMKITLDLLSCDNQLSGYYYYYFLIPGNDDQYHYGKTIPVEGNISDNIMILYEFNNRESKFTSAFNSLENISGIWERDSRDKTIPFEIYEDYSNGSLILNFCSLYDQHKLMHGDGSDDNSPKATIGITLLYPDLPDGNTLKDSIDFTLTEFLLNKPLQINSPEQLLEDIKYDFFDSYIKSTEGIEDLSSTHSFNWEKNISMDVCYNENNILTLGIDKYVRTGGANGILMTEYFVICTSLLKKLSLDDIFNTNYDDALNTILDNKLRKLNGIKQEEELTDVGFFVDKIEHNDNFYINNDGIGFFYNIYSIAPYSTGTTELFITFDELKNIVRVDHPFSWVRKD